jgi:hypothetical protein
MIDHLLPSEVLEGEGEGEGKTQLPSLLRASRVALEAARSDLARCRLEQGEGESPSLRAYSGSAGLQLLRLFSEAHREALELSAQDHGQQQNAVADGAGSSLKEEEEEALRERLEGLIRQKGYLQRSMEALKHCEALASGVVDQWKVC